MSNYFSLSVKYLLYSTSESLILFKNEQHFSHGCTKYRPSCSTDSIFTEISLISLPLFSFTCSFSLMNFPISYSFFMFIQCYVLLLFSLWLAKLLLVDSWIDLYFYLLSCAFSSLIRDLRLHRIGNYIRFYCSSFWVVAWLPLPIFPLL